MGFKVADLFAEITLKDDKLKSGLTGAQSTMQSAMSGMAGAATSGMNMVVSAVSAAAKAMAVGLVAGTAAVVAGLGYAVVKASDLNETISKTGFTFGPAAKTITDAADEMATKFGIGKQTFIDSATNIGLIAKGAGYSKEAAADLGVQFGKLAADVSSFDNVPVEDALNAMRSGLVGETMPLRRFGVMMNEDTVKAEALRMGLVRTGEELTNQAKIQARASVIATALADRTGDLERTQESFSNRTRQVGGQLENLAAQVGAVLLPAILATLTEKAEMVGTAWKHWPEAMALAQAQIIVYITNIKEAFLNLLANTGPIFERIADKMVTTMEGAAGKVIASWIAVSQFGEGQDEATRAQRETFEAQAAAAREKRANRAKNFSPIVPLELTKTTPELEAAKSAFDIARDIDKDTGLAKVRDAELGADHQKFIAGKEAEAQRVAEEAAAARPAAHRFAVRGMSAEEAATARLVRHEEDLVRLRGQRFGGGGAAGMAAPTDAELETMKAAMAAGGLSAAMGGRLRELAGAGTFGEEAKTKAELAAAQAEAKLTTKEKPSFVGAAEFVKTFQGGGTGTEAKKIDLMEAQLKEGRESKELLKKLEELLKTPGKGGATFAKRTAAG
jgi:hypothetical protein